MAMPVALPTDTVRTGKVVDLTPLVRGDLPALNEIAFANADEYRLTSTPTNEAESEAYFAPVLAARAAGTAHPVAVRDKSGVVLGTSRLSQYSLEHSRCELGFSWYHPRVFRTAVNTETKLLLLVFAFESLLVNRVQLQTDTRNLRSQRAITALGATFEGVLRRHMVVKGGYVRDTMIYAITDVTWPTVKAGLLARLADKLAAGGGATRSRAT
ncbi:MAG TPA: GNAT family protein [Trueperaceae bacterium]|nr:GNAT family protein [Trueperaceae bacterium]